MNSLSSTIGGRSPLKGIKRTLSLLAILLCAFSSSAYSQQAKGPLQLADQYFAKGEYYTAANLYGQYLNPPKKVKPASEFPINAKRRRVVGTVSGASKPAVLYKQAESYRLANYWPEAATLYKLSMDKYSSEFPDAGYWYAVCQRSLGNYSEAKDILNKYLSEHATGQYADAARQELASLEFISQQQARPDSVLFHTRKLAMNGSSERGVFAPVHIGGNQYMVSSTQPDSARVNGVNPYHSRLFAATVENGNITELDPINIPGVDGNSNQGAATISKNGDYLYFSQWKVEDGHPVSNIYYAQKQAGGWGQPKLFTSANVAGFSSKQPFCSVDGKYFFFSSDRPGGLGKFDIWVAVLNADGSIGVPVNAGSEINTSADEQAPFYQVSSRTMVFSSNGRTGMGGYDLFEANGSEAQWKSVKNLGHPVNSARDDIYYFVEENVPLLTNAYFSSDRGSGCCLETYTVNKDIKTRRLIGRLLDCRDDQPVANAEVILKDDLGKQWKTNTRADGTYSFELDKEVRANLSLSINRESFEPLTAVPQLNKLDESDMLVTKVVNEDLCISRKLVIRVEDVVTVFFDYDKSNLKPATVNKLDSIYDIMVANPVVTVQISGYTDGRGTVAYNAVLSDKRAKACAEYLISKGIDAERITFVSFGACCPVEMELLNGRDNAEGRSRNRRALINVKKD